MTTSDAAPANSRIPSPLANSGRIHTIPTRHMYVFVSPCCYIIVLANWIEDFGFNFDLRVGWFASYVVKRTKCQEKWNDDFCKQTELVSYVHKLMVRNIWFLFKYNV